MPVDINQGFETISENISKIKKGRELNAEYRKLKKKKGNNFEQAKQNLISRYENYKGEAQVFSAKTKNFLNKTKNQSSTLLDKLLEIKMESADNLQQNPFRSFGENVLEKTKNSPRILKYIIEKFITALDKTGPEMLKLLEDEMINIIGCDDTQTYIPNQDLYIKIKSIDLLGQLKVEPETNVGKVIYEQIDLQYPTFPFAMNKELYNRIQNLNQPFSVQYLSQYQGTSTQNLFDISYEELDNNNIPGEYYKVVLANRVTGNTVKSFMKDYLSTIKVLELNNVFGNLMNILTGAISIEKGDGKNDNKLFLYVFLIMRRIMGLCSDSTTEIDVSGSAKLSETDVLDDSFFELTDVDLNFIDQRLSDISNNVVEFEECQEVKLPLNSLAIVDAINQINFVPGTNNNTTIQNASSLSDTLTNNPDWKPLEINVDADFIKNMPMAVVFSLLSPKVLLPLAVVLKSLNNNTLDGVKDYSEFVKKFIKFFNVIVTKVANIFGKIILDLVVKDIKQLINNTLADIKAESNNKRVNVILALTKILTAIVQVFTDIRGCRNVIQSLLNALNLASRAFGDEIPLPLMLATKYLSGFSTSRAYLNVVSEFEKLGIPTGPMSDGSPNEFMAAVKAIIEGVDKEEAENGQVQVACEGFSITPIGITVPGFCYGKKL
jgi:hypothetical protein